MIYTSVAHLWEVVNNEVQRVFLHVRGLHPVGSLQDLHHIFERHVHLKVLLAERLQTVVSETIVVRYAEEVQRVLGRHVHSGIVYVAQKRIK